MLAAGNPVLTGSETESDDQGHTQADGSLQMGQVQMQRQERRQGTGHVSHRSAEQRK